LDGTGAWDTCKDSDLSTSDITTNDVTTSKHGFAPKAPNDATKFLDGTGAWTIPTGSGAEIKTATATWTSSYSSGTTSAEDLTDATITLSGLTSGRTYTIFAIASFSGDNNTDNNRLNSIMNMGGSDVNTCSHLQSGAGRDVPTTIHGLIKGVTGVTTYTAKIRVSSDGGTKRVNPVGHTQRISIIALQEV
jgi:hypothetical protein